MPTATGSFSVSSWKELEEDAYDEPEGGGKLTRATVELALSGAIDGDAAVEWLMAYRADGTAHFVGWPGSVRLDGRSWANTAARGNVEGTTASCCGMPGGVRRSVPFMAVPRRENDVGPCSFLLRYQPVRR